MLMFLVQGENVTKEPLKHEGLNFTKEISSASSFSRQLSEQMTLAKAYVIIAKEHNNLHLAWQLSNKIKNCQLLLSKTYILLVTKAKIIANTQAIKLLRVISALSTDTSRV